MTSKLKNALNGKVLVFVGMPGSGKTTLGNLIAEKTGMAWTDTDDMMRKADIEVPKHPILLADIQDNSQVADFLDAEYEYLFRAMEEGAEIISTGGSMVLNEHARNLLRSDKCFTVWLMNKDIPQTCKDRGIEYENYVKVMNERRDFYCESADFLFTAHDYEKPETAAEVLLVHAEKRLKDGPEPEDLEPEKIIKLAGRISKEASENIRQIHHYWTMEPIEFRTMPFIEYLREFVTMEASQEAKHDD